MTKVEFEQKVGIEVTYDEYVPIENYYMGSTEEIDTDRFIRRWLREGGINDLLDYRYRHILRLKKMVKALKEENHKLKKESMAIA